MERVVKLFEDIDANKSGTLSISEIVEFLKASKMTESAATTQALTWFNTLNTDHNKRIDLQEWKEFFGRCHDASGLESTEAMLVWLEDLIPNLIQSKVHSRVH